MVPAPADRPDLAPLIDHALLDPHRGEEAVRRCCDEARHFGFAAVCVASRWVPLARERLPQHDSVRLASVVGFPFGALADQQANTVLADLAAITALGLPVKVILETGRLDPEALALLVDVSIDAGARWLKTGSGFGPAVTPAEVSHLRSLARGRAGIKASGGIASLEQAFALVEAGATRLGTSRGVALMQALRQPPTTS